MKPSRLALVSFIVLAVAVLSEAKISSDESKNSTNIKAVNAAVDELEKRIVNADKTLPTLKTEFDFHDATEGVPPDLKFYFETKKVGLKEKAQLRVLKTHVGHEVYSIERTYYFDETGQPMKFLEVNSGIPGKDGFPESRKGIIFGKSGQKIWSSPEAVAPMSFNDVKNIFDTLNTGLKKFQ